MAARLLPLQPFTFSLLSCTHSPLSSVYSLKSCLFIGIHGAAPLVLLSTMVATNSSSPSTMVAANSQWLVPSICCTLMATNPTITPFAIHVGQLSSCFFSISLHLVAHLRNLKNLTWHRISRTWYHMRGESRKKEWHHKRKNSWISKQKIQRKSKGHGNGSILDTTWTEVSI